MLVFNTWQKAYQYYQKYYFDYKLDPLDMDNLVKILDDKSKTKYLDQKYKYFNTENIQFEDLLNQHYSQRNRIIASNNTKFSQYDINKNYDWLATKSYLVNIHNFINHLKI